MSDENPRPEAPRPELKWDEVACTGCGKTLKKLYDPICPQCGVFNIPEPPGRPPHGWPPPGSDAG